jgi:transposase-like protein
MRYPAAEKLEIIQLVEQSHLQVRRTIAKIGIPPTTFYRWYDRSLEHGPEGSEDRSYSPSRVLNRICEAVRNRILTLALEEPELSPRELAVKFTDTEKYLSQRLRSTGCSSPMILSPARPIWSLHFASLQNSGGSGWIECAEAITGAGISMRCL